jgi:peptide/nickel transport system substrate-binding protein
MKISGRAALAVAATAALFVVAVEAAGAGGNAHAKNGGTLTVGLADEPDALDPTLARTFSGRMVFTTFCEKLYDINKNLQIIPQLAASLPKISADKKTVTIKLRKGIKFNDGTPFNAQAVKAAIDRHKTLARSARASELTPVDSVDAVGSSTVVFHLNTPFAPLTSLLADRSGMIPSPTAVNKGNFAAHPVCVGAFDFVSRQAGDRITFKKSTQDYDKKKVHLAGIVFRIITQPSAMTAALRAGDIDVADRLQSSDLPSLRNVKSLRLVKATTIGYQGLTLNIGNKNGLRRPYANVGTPLAAHPGLRQAFELSLDRKAIARLIFNNTVTPGCGPISPVLKAWYDSKLKCSARNITRAKALVKASGAKTPITVHLMIGTDTVAARLGALIQNEAQPAGFNVVLQPTEFTTSLNKADAGDFDMFAIGFSGRVDPDGTVYGFVHTGGSLNDSGYSNALVDRLMDQARSARTPKARRTLYNAAFKIIAKDRPLIYLWYPNDYTGVLNKVSGISVYGDGLIRAAFAQFK